MKRVYLLCLACLFFLPASRALDASVTYATFKSPQQPYIEVYLHVLGGSVVKLPVADSLFQSKVEVLMLLKQGENIVKFDKYVLNSPASKKSINMYDLKRFGLANGVYTLEVTVKDLNRPEDIKTYREEVEINFAEPEGVMQSDIQLLADFRAEKEVSPAVKNGYYLEALPFNFYHKKISKLVFYNEIYNVDKVLDEEPYLVRYYVESVKGNGTTETVKIGNKKRTPQPVTVFLLQMDISDLPSGNYNLVVETRKRSGEEMSRKQIFFQRSNPYLDLEKAKDAPLEETFVERLDAQALRYSLKAIAPIVEDTDSETINILVADRDNLDRQRRYLYTFWISRRPNEPEKAYDEYMEVARAVDKLYDSGFGYGFESDRGRAFMRYGKPDDIVTVLDEPLAPPYEIWVYYYFPYTKQTNVKFLFYNPTLAAGQYELLHSTARGEEFNPQWELELYRDAPDEIEGDDYISGTQMQDRFHRNARRYFNDF